MTSAVEERRVYIREAAELLDRRIATLRHWDREDILPVDLRPERGTRGWRYWTESQVERIRDWMKDTDRRPGRNLSPNYGPDHPHNERQLKRMRGPRKLAA